MSPPNILLIITDQQSHAAMSCAGNQWLHTPGMDGIASSGTRFTNAYCANPVCVPSRVSLFTGQFPHEFGIYSNTRSAPKLEEPGVHWLGKQLESAGYQNIYFGKWHLVIGQTKEKLGTTGFTEGFMMNADTLLAGACEDFLDEWTEEGRKKPFFMVLSFVNPHNICQWARREALPEGAVGDPPPAEDCPPLPQNFQKLDDEPGALRKTRREFAGSIYPTSGWSDDDWRQYLWGYNRMVEKVDAEIVKVLEAVARNEIDGETAIIFTSDHGDGLAAHQWNQKQALWENVTKVPLVLKPPGVPLAQEPGTGRTRDDLVSSGPDIYATVLDMAGVPAPGTARGLSLKPIVEGTSQALGREFVVSETELGSFTDVAGEHHGRAAGRMVRTREYKYCVYNKGENREQLFHLPSDPGEMTNLASNPAYESALESHRDLLLQWCAETGDDLSWSFIKKQ